MRSLLTVLNETPVTLATDLMLEPSTSMWRTCTLVFVGSRFMPPTLPAWMLMVKHFVQF